MSRKRNVITLLDSDDEDQEESVLVQFEKMKEAAATIVSDKDDLEAEAVEGVDDDDDLPEFLMHIKPPVDDSPMELPAIFSSDISRPVTSTFAAGRCERPKDLKEIDEFLSRTDNAVNRSSKAGGGGRLKRNSSSAGISSEFSLEALLENKNKKKSRPRITMEEFHENVKHAPIFSSPEQSIIDSDNDFEHGRIGELADVCTAEIITLETMEELLAAPSCRKEPHNLNDDARVQERVVGRKKKKNKNCANLDSVKWSFDLPLLQEVKSFRIDAQFHLDQMVRSELARLAAFQKPPRNIVHLLEMFIALAIDGRFENHGNINFLLFEISRLLTAPQMVQAAESLSINCQCEVKRLRILQSLPKSTFKQVLAWNFFIQSKALNDSVGNLESKKWNDLTVSDFVLTVTSLKDFNPTAECDFRKLRTHLLYLFTSIPMPEKRSPAWTKFGKVAREMLFNLKDEKGMDPLKTLVKEVLIQFEIICQNSTGSNSQLNLV